MNSTYQIIFCTCPDKNIAMSLAELLIKQQLAACVNIVPGITSVYRWQGKVQNSEEYLLVIKTETARYEKLEQAITAAHPYDVPEIVAIPIIQGSSDYLAWISAAVSSNEQAG